MDRVQIVRVLETLTEKQDEALRLASQHLTSKQIANQLGIAPVTVDKRIDSVRAKLDFLPRTDVLRHYRAWKEGYGQTIDGPIILTTPDTLSASTSSQPQEPAYFFEDALSFDARSNWDGNLSWMRPRVKLSDLGALGKLAFMIVGAVALMSVAVLSVAFATALGSMLGS